MDCNVTCVNIGFLGLGVVRFGCIGEILCCLVSLLFQLFLHLPLVMLFEYLVA